MDGGFFVAWELDRSDPRVEGIELAVRKKKGKGPWRTYRLNGPHQFATIDGLTNRKKYQVKIRLYSPYATTKWSKKKKIRPRVPKKQSIAGGEFEPLIIFKYLYYTIEHIVRTRF